MRQFRTTGLSALLLLFISGATHACEADARQPATIPAVHLVISQSDGSFIIRASLPLIATEAGSPCCAIALGNTVRFDRSLLLPSPIKEHRHGEIR
jgi:hypothetical protein